MSKPAPRAHGFAYQQAEHIRQLQAQIERLTAELARVEGERDMLKAQNAELKRLLDAAPRCERCERTELMRRVLAVSLPAPILRAEIENEIGEKVLDAKICRPT